MENDLKYELTNESIDFDNRKLYRIRALKDFKDIKKGSLGGYVESTRNLSQHGSCWVKDNALVYGNARIYDDAEISDNAKVYGNAIISDKVVVFNNAEIFSNARIFHYATICNNARIYDNAIIQDHAVICGNARIFDLACVCDYARACDNVEIYGNAKLCNYARVCEDAKVYGNAEICDYAQVFGIANVKDTTINNNQKIIGNVTSNFKDILQAQLSTGRLVTAILTFDDNILYSIGCQHNITEKVFINRINNNDGGIKVNPHRENYLKFIKIAKEYFYSDIEE